MWVIAYCERSIPPWKPKDLYLGIAARLPELTVLFDPDEQEDPDQVLGRLRIAPFAPEDPASLWHIRYRDNLAPIVLSRTAGDECAGRVREELTETALGRNRNRQAKRIREILGRVTEEASFCLKASALESMGFPVAIAAAAFLVEQAGGVIKSCNASWMVPTKEGVEIILEYEE
jgi:hypothetical protein